MICSIKRRKWEEYTRHYEGLFKVLAAGGARCSAEASGHPALSDLCSQIANEFGTPEEDKLAALQVKPPEGSLPEVDAHIAVAGSNGPVFTITANTDYRDVDYALVDDSGLFEIANNGGFVDHTGENGEWRLRVNTLSDDPNNPGEKIYRSKEGVISAKSPLTAPASYTFTVRATFFYHVHVQEAVERVVELKVVEQAGKVTRFTNDKGTLDSPLNPFPFFVGLNLSSARNTPELRFTSGIGFDLTRALEIGESAEDVFALTADNLAGVLSVTIFVEHADLNNGEYLRLERGLDCAPPSGTSETKAANDELDEAIVANDEHRVCAAIRNGANVNRDFEETSLLNRAIATENLDLQRVMLSHGAQHDREDLKIGHALNGAARAANYIVGEFLLRHNPSQVDTGRIRGGIKPIHSLGQRSMRDAGNGEKFAQVLVDYDVDVDGPTDTAWTYLHYVGRHGQYDSMEPILDDGPNPHKHTTEGFLPLAVAVKNQRNGVIEELLIYADALTLTVNKAENETFKAAIHYVQNVEDLDLLMCAGADLHMAVGGTEATPDNGKTAKALIAKEFEGDADATHDLNWWLTRSQSVTDNWCLRHHPEVFNNSRMVASR